MKNYTELSDKELLETNNKTNKMKNEMYYLESVNKFLIFETCELVSINENTRIINFNDIQSIGEMKDSWFALLSDEELLKITDRNIIKRGIPFVAINEVRKRGLKKFVNRTINSFDFDSKGNFIN